MKNKISSIFVILMIIQYSCDKSIEKYSCDESINEWVIQNKSDIDTMSRAYFIKLPLDYQVAAFNYLNHSQKVDLWQSKLSLLLSQEYYNEQAKSSIRTLQSLVCEDLYNGSLNFSESIIWNIMNESGLDSISVVIDFATLFTYDELESYIENYDQIHYEWFGEDYEIRAPEPRPKCMCRWNITCGIMNHGLCEDGWENCTATSYGCGWFGMESCGGRCDGNPFQHD